MPQKPIAILLWSVFFLLGFAGCSANKPANYRGMILIEGGDFQMGTDDGYPFEGPTHSVQVGSFYLDETEVTNGQFRAFVEATDFVTESEKQGSSGIFDAQTGEWSLVDGADWQHPAGPGSSIEGQEDHPVVHVSWDDASAFAKWAGKRLPTEAEWEYAAKGGRDQAIYPWGNELSPGGQLRANFWQGVFPLQDESTDGFPGVAPVKQFPPNGYGLHDMIGNVWEWVGDWYAADYYRRSPARSPNGPREGTEKVHRGGSWICSRNYCQGFRVAARQKTTTDTALNNLGFRCAAD